MTNPFTLAWSFLRYKEPTATAPKKPESTTKDKFLDFTFSNLSTISNSLTPSDLQGILETAADGYCSQQALLIKEIQEREPIISAHLQTRKGSIVSKDWTITSVNYPDRAEKLNRMLRSANLSDTIQYLTDFIATGYSYVTIDWQQGGAGINGFVPIVPEAIQYDQGGNAALVNSVGIKIPVTNYHPNQFLFCKSQCKPGIPSRNGLVRTLVWMYLFKHSGISGYARYCEKFGIPFLLAKLPQSAWAQRNTVLNSLKAMGKDSVGAVPEGTELEVINGANSGSTQANEQFIRYCDEVFTLSILGQLGSSAVSSGLSKGDAQSAVRQDLLSSDCQQIINTVQKQIIEPICKMKWGMTDSDDIQFWIDYSPPKDLSEKAKQWKLLTEITGRKIDYKFVQDEFGVKFSEEDSEEDVSNISQNSEDSEESNVK